MSNIPVKRSFTAPDTKQYITAPWGSFFYIYNIDKEY